MNSEIPLTRSSSSNLIISKQFACRGSNQSSNKSLSRNSSYETNKTVKSSKTLHSSNKSFIKPKPKHSNPADLANDSHSTSSNPKEKVYPTCLKDYALLDEITSKFTLKTIESIKKDFANNEVLYSHLIAVLAELDSIFDKNQNLQFAMSRAKEVFHLYFSRPGHVLNTFRNLPKLAETVRVSKKVVSHCAGTIRALDKSKFAGVSLEILEALKRVTSIQNKMFKAKVFIATDPATPAGAGALDDKNLEVSIMELTTQPYDTECQSISPIQPTEPDEPVAPVAPVPLVPPPQSQSKAEKSSKAKILDQLFQRIKSIPHNKENSSDSAPAIKLTHEASQTCLKEISQNLNLNPNPAPKPAPKANSSQPSIKIKQKRAASNSPVPGYMLGLKRQDSLNSKQVISIKSSKVSKVFQEKKKDWEEVRMVFIK